ncbi:MAG: dicarboxylate/amino acid:cation symporter [Spirochaetales bacterium]|nr:dicarboxylate/amino acid:cation symporter [Spirochaetales bacterium]
MKIWIKLVLGIAIGTLTGFLIPQFKETVGFWAELIGNIGRYGLFPLVFFSVPLAILELRKEKQILKYFGLSMLYLAAASLILIILGTVTVLLLVPNRIPIIIEKEQIIHLPGIRELLAMIFPSNIFSLLNSDGNYLFPLYVFAFFMGLNFSFDRIITRPAVQLFDSFSRIFYHINTFIVELMGIGIIALSAYWIIQINTIPDFEIFTQTILLLSINGAIVVFGLYPAIMYFALKKENPYKWLYALITPVMTGFFSSNYYFSMPSLVHHSKENLGIPRKGGIPVLSLYALFGKAGTAMVSSITFLIIIRSYSSLGISVSTFFWVILFSYLTSFISGPMPGLGTYVSLMVLCRLYGQGIEEGYLIVAPVMPILLSIATAIDVLTAGLGTYLSARHMGFTKEVKVKDYA